MKYLIRLCLFSIPRINNDRPAVFSHPTNLRFFFVSFCLSFSSRDQHPEHVIKSSKASMPKNKAAMRPFFLIS